MLTDLGPTRIGVNPDNVCFQGSSRSAATCKAIPLFKRQALTLETYNYPTPKICWAWQGYGIFFQSYE